jgi:hypothetical protein
MRVMWYWQPDLFNGTVAANPEEAGHLAGAVRDNPSNAIKNLQSAVRYLASEKRELITDSIPWMVFRGKAIASISVKY